MAIWAGVACTTCKISATSANLRPASCTNLARIVASTKQLIFFDQGTNEVEPVTDDMPINCACYNSLSLTLLTASESSVKICVRSRVTSSRLPKSRRARSAQFASTIANASSSLEIQGNIGVFNYSNGALAALRHNRELSVPVVLRRSESRHQRDKFGCGCRAR